MSIELAKKLYNAYGDSADWKNFSGGPMPTWTELPEKIKEHWRATALAAIELSGDKDENV